MLVLVGPPFQGTEQEYAALAAATGLVPYELKTKIRPGAWGVARALASDQMAADLGERLRALGFRVAVVDPIVVADPSRVHVPLRGIELGADEMVLALSERTIAIPYRALLTIVRGEVQTGPRPRSRPSSSSTFRAVVPGVVELEGAPASQFDGFAAADLHFATVLWSARIDARSFDFSVLGQTGAGSAQDLDRLVDLIAERTGLRVDRAVKQSSVASFAGDRQNRTTSPVPGQPPSARASGTTERFDAYSRLVAEAERQAARAARISTRPPPG